MGLGPVYNTIKVVFLLTLSMEKVMKMGLGLFKVLTIAAKDLKYLL